MMEPAGANRRVRLRRSPHRAVGIAVLQRGDDAVTGRPRIRNRSRVHRRPVRVARRTGFVAAPAHVGAGVGEHHRVGLEPPHQAEHAQPIVFLPAPVGPFAVGAVEPHLGNGAVARQQLGELLAVEVVVAGRVPVHRRVAIPRRQIQTGAQPLAPARVGELAHHVPRTAAPRAPRHRVRREPAGPQAEPVVMLGGEDQRACAGGPAGPGPLACVQRRRVEHRRVLAPVAPLVVRERVDPEMEEQRQLVALPDELRGRGTRAGRLRPRKPHHAPAERRGHRGREGPSGERHPLYRAGTAATSNASAFFTLSLPTPAPR